MPATTDILVVGSGLAGLTAALSAWERGARVRLIAFGAGALSIGSGCVDLLGYLDGEAVDGDPLQALSRLPRTHPYRLVGHRGVVEALDFFAALCRAHGWPLLPALPRNRLLPTIMGTLKPSYLCPVTADDTFLHGARRVLVAGVEGLRDCQPSLVSAQLRRHAGLESMDFRETLLPAPLGMTRRNITALDVARHVDTPEGFSWLTGTLGPRIQGAHVVLLPPFCGTAADGSVWRKLRDALGCPILELLTLPPGVGGLRLRRLLLEALREAQVDVVENVRVIRADVRGKQCAALISEGPGGETVWRARSYILATGGFLGGGSAALPGAARESVFGLPLEPPEGGALPPDVTDWSAPQVFGRHLFARLGVRVDARLRPVDGTGNVLLDNVHFAGRSLGGYDPSTEKSGNGVALITGRHAALMAR